MSKDLTFSFSKKAFLIQQPKLFCEQTQSGTHIHFKLFSIIAEGVTKLK